MKSTKKKSSASKESKEFIKNLLKFEQESKGISLLFAEITQDLS
jgi:hypothetical protein